MNKMELLAPAGSLEALQAAVESGADAVYIGGNRFNARAFAQNLDEDMLKKAVEYAHIRGARVYVTVNILILQKEIEEVIDYIFYLYNINVDAVIVQDFGLAAMIRKLLPDFEVHCSTQMAIHNTDGAEYLSKLGINRVVLARELTLAEVNEIAEKAAIEAEIFIHGALCVCYSGQCYMSSMIGGRSGNRGRCAQPCRKKYRLAEGSVIHDKGAHLISTKDLNTYDNLYKIAESKVASLKIEGRMKRPEYVAVIVKNYRDAIDCIMKGNADCISPQAEYELMIAFNREFTKGYLFRERNQEIVSIDRPDNRGIYIGKVLNQKGSIAEILIESNYLNDGDGIEVIGPKGKSTGCTISGIKKNGETVKKAAAGDRVRLFIPEKVLPGSLINKTIDSELFEKARNEYAFTNRKKIDLEGIFTAKLGQNPVFEVRDKDGNIISAAADEIVQRAEKQALSKEKVLEQLSKTGDTPYIFENLKVELDPDCFMPVKTINNLRRNALEQLNTRRIEMSDRKRDFDIKKASKLDMQSRDRKKAQKTEMTAGIRNIDNARAAVAAGADTIYILGDYNYKANERLIDETAELCKNEGKAFYYVLPQITRNNEVAHFEKMLADALKRWDNMGIVLSNLGHIPLAQRLKPFDTRGNFSLNVFNAVTAKHLNLQGMTSLCVSPELNLPQIKELADSCTVELEGLVYGYLPAMVTEYCPGSTERECSSCNRQGSNDYGIVDEKDKLFRVINLGNCRNIFLNSDVLCVYDNLSSIIENDICKIRLDFYIENNEEVFDIINAYRQKLENLTSNMEHANSMKNAVSIDHTIIGSIKEKGFTRGHYFRGVD